MKNAITIIAAVIAAAAIVMFMVISWTFDNWFTGVITGVSLAAYPSWVKESFTDKR